jgi:eukaryotic-like serine/threonine-protein kinase
MHDKLIIDDLFEYEIKEIKEGGMGIVLILERLSDACPFDLTHRLNMAVKTFKDDYVKQNMELFERELNIWINLDHPNIAALIKVIFIKNRLYGLMPYYDHSLGDILVREGMIGINNSIVIIQNIIHGLNYAFENYGIVHHDLKPNNILLKIYDNDSIYYCVSDWGIANIQKSICPLIPKNECLPSSFIDTMTQIGTLPYMSPERLIGFPSDVRFDIYSLGLIFFQLLCGHLPFFGPKPLQLQIIESDYFHNASEKLKKVSDSKVRSLILKCIHPNIDLRYNNYKELSRDLNNLIKRKKFLFF